MVSEYFSMAFSVEIRGPSTIAQVEKKWAESEFKDVPSIPYGSDYGWSEFKSKVTVHRYFESY